MDPNNPSTGRSYSQMAILTASDGQSVDWFGSPVDIDGDVILVGASEIDLGGPGVVYIFRIGDNNNISQMAKITEHNGVAGDCFGCSIAIHGNLILVGAQFVRKDYIFAAGSAYMFVNPSSNPNTPDWTQIMQFQPNDLTTNDWFGLSVAMDDQIAVMGTWNANAAYVFVPVNENVNSLSLWTQMAKLTGPTDSDFGASVAVAGNSIVVGAWGDDNTNGNDAGAVFVFTKIDDTTSSSSSWTQTNILLAADGADGDSFGSSISISKDASTIVVGADWDDYNSTITESGAAYLFRNSTTTVGWTQVGKFVAADRYIGDELGSSIAIEKSIVVVGAPFDDTASGEKAGSVHVLDTGFSSPPTTTTPTTTAPTANPVAPTVQPTSSPTTKPTSSSTMIQPTTMDPTLNNDDKDNGNNNNPTSLPATSNPTTKVPTVATPTIPDNNTTSTSRDPAKDTDSISDNDYIIIASIIAGAVVVVVALGIFNYRLRVKREDHRRLEQQQQSTILPQLSPSSSGNNGMIAVNIDETPVIANAVFPTLPIQPAEGRTVEADILLDPPPTFVPPAAAVVNIDTIDAVKSPHFKDQVHNSGPLKPSREAITSQIRKAKEP